MACDRMIGRFECCSVVQGDCLELMRELSDGCVDACVTDPPYGVTSFRWDSWPVGWLGVVCTSSLWCFGSLRTFMENAGEFDCAGWKMSQDIVWEKHNGSNFHADRFRRVHEIAAHFYRGDWSDVYHEVPMTNDATARTVRRKGHPPHLGMIESGSYFSHDGGPRLMRSVISIPSCHGVAEHPTQKPTGIVEPLIEYSSSQGSTILDPFCGSGTTLVAAKKLGRHFLGFEISEDYCNIARDRLARIEAQPTLFAAQAEQLTLGTED